MKISAVVWSVHRLIEEGKMTQNEFISLCSEIGLDGVDLFDHLIPGSNEDERIKGMDEVISILETNNMVLASYIVHNDFTNEDNHEENLSKVKRAIKEAKYLKSNSVRILGGSTSLLGTKSRKEGLKAVTEGLRKASIFAEEYEMLLVLENHGDLPGRAVEMLSIIEDIKSPCLKLCFDMGNFLAGNVSVKQDPLESLKKVIGAVEHVHVKDRRFKPGVRGDVETCIAGTGAVPLEECLRVLRKNKYHGFVSCECEGEEGISVLTAFRNSAANIKTAIERACMDMQKTG